VDVVAAVVEVVFGQLLADANSIVDATPGSSVKTVLQCLSSGFRCAGCSEWNETTVDECARRSESYVQKVRLVATQCAAGALGPAAAAIYDSRRIGIRIRKTVGFIAGEDLEGGTWERRIARQGGWWPTTW
jgi:hypothetical protein